jgi:hypothetical protein
MMKFRVMFEDLNYEKWARDCGAEFQKLEPREDGGFDLHLKGTPASLARFASDLG